MSSRPRNTIVTGGTGALGASVVQAFLDAGDRVVVPWIVERENESLAAGHGAALAAGRLVLVRADVASEDGAKSVASAAGAADVLVNGVGGFAGGAPVLETGLDVWDRMWAMNVRTAVAMSRAALPAMRLRAIEELTAAQLYATLAVEAEAMYLSDFQKRYKNPVSMGLRLAHTKKELGRWFEIEICKQPNGQRLYSFKGIGVDIKAKTTGAEADKAAAAWLKEAKRGKKGGLGKKPQGAERDDEPVDD